MEVIIGKLVSTLIKPPGLILSLMLLGVILRLRFYRTGQGFIFGGVFLLIAFSMPVFSGMMARLYEDTPVLDVAAIKKSTASAIVVLAGGQTDAPEYQGHTVSRYTLERIRYGAYLQRQTRLPILVTGGRVYGDESIAEAELMQQVLEKEFLAIVRWVENKSRTTYENAVFTQTILASENINHILLVTHAIHMPRAKEAFEQAGFTVTPAPMGLKGKASRTIISGLLPSAGSLKLTNELFHEWIGRLWYKLRYYR
jgi:uncharacterized SAM-binding protein YcdF (DUF218 family)